MGARRIGSLMVGVSLVLCVGHVSARAADVAEAAEPAAATPAVADPALEQIHAAINAETDPELRAAMEEQLHLLETGQLELTDRELGRGAAGGGADALPEGRLTDPLSSGGRLGQSTDAGVGPRGDEDLPAEARARLEQLFQEEGTGNPALDGEVRAKAEGILKEYGIDQNEFGPDHEGDYERGGFGRGGYEARGQEDGGRERAFEQMSPEAREQMERFSQERELGSSDAFREMERGVDGPTHEHDASMWGVEAPTSDAPTHEYEAPAAYEAPQQESQAAGQPEHDYQPPQP
jgi:hypothetical protein